MKTIIMLLMLLPGLIMAQNRKFGAYAQVGSETIYNKNFYTSVGVRYKELRVGYFHQSANVPNMESVLLNRKGLLTELGLINVDELAYLSVGARVAMTNNSFVSVIPHFSVAFRHKFVEIPITLSTYKGSSTGLISLRVIF
jgi:hypothetical protein